MRTRLTMTYSFALNAVLFASGVALAKPVSVDDAAFFGVCGFNGDVVFDVDDLFVRDGAAVASSALWTVKDEKSYIGKTKLDRDDFLAKSYSNRAPFKNPVCELELLRRMETQNSSEGNAYVKNLKKARCEHIKDTFLPQYITAQNTSAGSVGFGSSESVFGGGGGSSSGGSEACEDLDNKETFKFACKYRDVKKKLANADQKAAAEDLQRHCVSSGAEMIYRGDAASLARAGLLPYGGAYCGYGAPIVIEKNTHPAVQITNGVLNFLKPMPSIISMYKISKMQQQNAKFAIKMNHDLGFPSAVGTAGGISGGYGAGNGGGGFCGGSPCHGGGYTGYGGSCPYGGCYGNGGMVVGGGGYAGGVIGGGNCGMPPMAPGYQGCGAGYGYGPGAGQWGGGYGPGGGQYGPGGPGGQNPYWANNPVNQNQLNEQAKRAEEYARRVAMEARKAKAAAEIASRYRKDWEAAGEKYQEAMGTYYSSYSYLNSAPGLGMPGYGQPTQTGACGGYSCCTASCMGGGMMGYGGGGYYPPYASGGGSGVNLNFQYSKQ